MGNQIQITDNAAKRVGIILQNEPAGSMLRVSVEGGGCSGFQYKFGFDTVRADDDLAVERDGVIMLVDAVSAPFLDGAAVDFVDDLMGQAFKITNPNATASCGCGTSFSV